MADKQTYRSRRITWRIGRHVALAAVAGVLFGACIGSDSDSPESSTNEEDAITESSPVGAGAATNAFATASSGIPLVKGPGGTGAGLLLEGGYVLTTSDIVGPGQSATIRFPGDDDAQRLTVSAVHPLADVVLLGPIETDVEPPQVASLDEFDVGSKLFAIGYAADDADASILQTIVAGITRWDLGGLEQVRIDQPGILLAGPSFVVADDGAVVAIRTGNESTTGLGTPVSEFTAALLAAATAGSPGRVLDAEPGLPEQTVELDSVMSQRLYAFSATAGKPVTLVLTTESLAGGSLAVFGPSGNPIATINEFVEGRGQVTLTPKVTGRYTTIVYVGSEPASFLLSSDANLSAFGDPDDMQPLLSGARVVGAIDYPGDIDVFLLELRPGEHVTLRVEGMTVDPLLRVAPVAGGEPLADDDGGGGVFGTAALIDLVGGEGGTFVVQVSDALLAATGGYVLTVEGVATQPDIQAAVTTIQGLVDVLQETDAGQAALRELLQQMVQPPPLGLPAAFGAAWRGTVQGEILVTDLATTDTTEAGTVARSVDDDDGRFTVLATILVSGAAEATASVVNAEGSQVALGNPRLSATCAEGQACLTTVSFDVTDAAALGPWTVSLELLNGSISSWQMEVHRDPADLATPSLPAE
jgi:hypothetical protein